ncbi:lipopolysaccharide heptosyltransferase I [Neisseriaceae bacterium TC5R-5]|nr:lipopolysaccharide heptosyltransferase I [Neisseriaceae bacterium TC5R-5]
MNLLIVRTSSMGDLIHTWPAISELKKHYPNFRISWLVEKSFADIASLHPAVDQVITMNWRRWRAQLWQLKTWREIASLRQHLKAVDWDVVLDSQGLLRSAFVASWTKAPLAGFDWRSVREPLASLFYHKRYRVDWNLSAVERNRSLFAQAFGYTVASSPQFGITAGECPVWLAQQPYAVLLHATSRAAKQWPETHWCLLAKRLFVEQGLTMVLPWGSEPEKHRAERLVAQMPAAVLAPKMSLREAAGLLAHAQAVIGVDTGLTHLANALNIPLVAIYTDTDPARTGVVPTPYARNLGNVASCPGVDEVMEALLLCQAGV